MWHGSTYLYTSAKDCRKLWHLILQIWRELDETKPAGSIKIRVETIVYYLEKYSQDIIQKKLKRLGPIPKELL